MSHQPPRPQAATYDIDEPALGAAHLRATTPAELADAIRRLATDPDRRRAASAAALAASAAMRDRGAWVRAMEGAYERARAGRRRPARDRRPRPRGHRGHGARG